MSVWESLEEELAGADFSRAAGGDRGRESRGNRG